ncbi:MAG: TIGR01620 family protein [Xanthobacteraceae bacterium]
MSTAEFRRPAAFHPDDPNVVLRPAPLDMASRPTLTTVGTDPEALETSGEIRELTPAPRWRMPWGTLFWSAAGGLVVLGLGLAVANLISDLFARADSLGYLGLGLAVLAGLAAAAILVREAYGIARLKAIDHLRDRAAQTLLSDDRDAGRGIVRELLLLTRRAPGLARARARLEPHLDEIIDGRDLVRIAERELMADLDTSARRLVSDAAKRVSVVTAVSPRAAVDMVFVLVTALGLVRRLSLLYGGRPGTLGLARLMRHVISHLAITGGMTVTDGLVQQMIGHGLAAKLSARLGEGVLNGLLTARLGLAAIEVTRPLPFSALRQPSIQDLATGLIRSVERGEEVTLADRARATAD